MLVRGYAYFVFRSVQHVNGVETITYEAVLNELFVLRARMEICRLIYNYDFETRTPLRQGR